MNLLLVPELQGKYPALTALLSGQIAAFVQQNGSVCKAIINHSGASRDEVLKYVGWGTPPDIMPMHQADLGPANTLDWITYLTQGGQVAVLGELLDCYEKDQSAFFTRQVISVVLMGVIQTIKDAKGTLPVGDRNVYFGTIAYNLRAFADDAFGPLGWTSQEYIPDRGVLANHGCVIPTPNPNATHP